jgi:YbbR domain-containing protein
MRWHPFRHLGLKVAALALGTLLWFVVSGQQVVRSVSAPVIYLHPPTGLQITGRPLQEVNVHIRGGYSQISQLGRNEVAVVADLADQKAGAVVLALSPNQVSAPLGIDVTQVDPGTVTVLLEKAGSAALPIHAIPVGTPAPGFMVGRITVDPATAVVIGPVSHLETLGALTAETISVEGATKDVTQTVNIGVADPELRLRDARTVRVTVQIVRKSGG